jgi:hypothetical protein
MSSRHLLKEYAFKKHLALKRLKGSADLRSFIERFKSQYIATELIRVGGESDGGYLLPPILDSIDYCFSPGVSYTASFEETLAQSHKIECFMADASVETAPSDNELFDFTKKYIGARTEGHFITLTDWYNQCVSDRSKKAILQMDIEGAEFEVLAYESIETLSQFSIIIIEFHGLERLFERDFLRFTASIFEKLYNRFAICHVHPNNCRGIAKLDDLEVPRVMEVTFLRKDNLHLKQANRPIQLPHPLDRKNVAQNEDCVMPKIWWA